MSSRSRFGAFFCAKIHSKSDPKRLKKTSWNLSLVLGRFCSLNTLIYTYALPGALFLVMSPFLPESPLWLTKRGKDEEAVKALEIIRGREYPVQVN